MVDSWVNSAEAIGADLHLELAGQGGRRAALTRALREAVRSGRLAPGTRLPPYRSLAADLGGLRPGKWCTGSHLIRAFGSASE
ncbi:hypothetical protein GCM10020256_59100 [Streptomyces thermocoprophilus]